MLSHMNFENVDIAICHCVHEARPTEGTDAEKFCQSVQKRCGEKEREENKKEDNCKAFSVTHKHNIFGCELETGCWTHSIFTKLLEPLFSNGFDASMFQKFVCHDTTFSALITVNLILFSLTIVSFKYQKVKFLKASYKILLAEKVL